MLFRSQKDLYKKYGNEENRMHTRHKRGYKFTDKTQSRRGIIAFILAVISLADLVAVIICSFQNGGNGSMYLGSVGVSSMLVGLIALFNAVLSLREENSYRFFPYLATICAFLAVGAWTALYVVGFLL